MMAWEKIKEAARRRGLRRFWRRAPAPTNWRAPDASPAAIAESADYAVHCGRSYLSHLRRLKVAPESARLLEIGPGVGFGAMIYLRTFGASVAVADRWLTPWRPEFHTPYYKRILDRLESEAPEGDYRALQRMIAREAYDADAISLIPQSAESLSAIADSSIDVVISNAVLEHLSDPAASFAELRRITAAGGYGVHQVDFRDHRDFARPLEHLLFASGRFAALSESVHTEYGSQLRQPDYAALLEAAGFAVLDYAGNDRADEVYLDDFVPRLRACATSDYRDAAREVLADLGGLFFVQRQPA